MTRRRTVGFAASGVLALALGVTAVELTGRAGVLTADASPVPTARVTRGSLDLTVHALGEVRASQSKTLSAPSVGGMLRLLRLAETGSAVHAGDVLMEFDPTEQQYALEQALSQLAEAEEQIAKMHADTEAQAAADQVTLLTARFDLRRAELDAIEDQRLIAANDYAKRRLALDEAKRGLAQVEADVTSRAETSRAGLAVDEAKRATAQLAADRARQNIESLVVKAPIDGFVVVRENRDAAGGFMFSGMTLPEYRAGDNVFAGRPVADVVDISRLEIHAKISELESDNVKKGEPADVRSDEVPDVSLTAKVSTVSGMSQSGDFFGSNGPLREFDVTLQIDQVGAPVRPGTSVQLVLQGARVDGALLLPRQAIFEKNGKPVVYLRTRDGFQVRDVRPVHRTEDRVAVEGVDEGAEVALVNPETAARTASKPAASMPGAKK